MKNVIIIPTYNEKENIARIVHAIVSLLPEAEIVVVDDNSPDGTAEIVKNLQKEHSQVHLLSREKKEGLGKAYTHAFTYVLEKFNPSIVTMMDSDFSHDPKNLPGMQKVLETGKATVVVGARYVKGGGTSGWELWRRMLSYFGNLYVRMVTRIPLHDLTAGFIMMKADTLAKIKYDNISASGYAFLIELKYLLWKSGARFFEWPIIFVNRTGGESKISNHIVSEGIVTPWKIKLKN